MVYLITIHLLQEDTLSQYSNYLEKNKRQIVIKEAIMNYLHFLKLGSGRMMEELLLLNICLKVF